MPDEISSLVYLFFGQMVTDLNENFANFRLFHLDKVLYGCLCLDIQHFRNVTFVK